MASPDEQELLVLDNYYDLRSQLLSAAHDLRNDGSSKSDILQRLASMHVNLDTIGQYFSLHISTQTYNHRRPPNSTTARNVLHIPELLELILLEADVSDGLSMYAACKPLQAIIDGSTALRSKLRFCRIAHPTSESLSFHPLTGVSWFNITKDKKPHTYPRVVERINAEFKVKKQDQDIELRPGNVLPPVGTRWMRMQICKPILTVVNVVVECIKCHSSCTKPQPQVSNPAGVTFYDLYSRAEQIEPEVGGHYYGCSNPHRGGVLVIFRADYAEEGGVSV